MSGILLRIHGIHNYSFVNGPGKRCVIHLQGCNLACPGCFNPQTHSMDGGVLLSLEELLTSVPEDVDGVTLSGGEPFLQSEGLLGLVRGLRRRKLSIIVYTGFTLKELERIPHSQDILQQIDVLIDGRYDQNLPRTNGTAGSVNQTIHLLTDKYVPADFENRQVEITVNPDGTMQITGFPFAHLLRSIQEMTTTLNTWQTKGDLMNNLHDLQHAIVRDINSLHQAGGLFQTLFRLQGVTLNQNNYNQIIQGFSSAQSLSKDRIEALTGIIFHYLNIRVEQDMAVSATEQQKAPAHEAASKPSTNVAAPATRQEALPKIDINKDSYKALHDAITKGDLHTVKVHLHSGAKIDHKFRSGFTPLLLAAKHQQWSIADFLVTQGADINAVNNDNFTLLSAVISEKKQDLFERLMSLNIHQNVLDMGISSCVLNLADRFYIDRLKAKGARLTQRLADFLLGRNEPRFVEYIFQHELLDRHSLNQSLIEACGSYRRNLSVIKRFVSQGADIRCKAQNDRNLIIVTVYTSGYDVFEYDDESLETELDDQQIAVIHYLTEQGVDINEPDVVGRTALHYAVGMNHLSMASFLLRKGANPHLRDLLGKTPLDYADEKGYDEIANLLAGSVRNGRTTSFQSSPSDQSSTAQPAEVPGRRKLKLNFEE